MAACAGTMLFLSPLPAASQPQRSQQRAAWEQSCDPGRLTTETSNAARMGHVKGTVTSLSYGAGLVELAAGDRRVQLRADPEQLAGLLPGQVTTLVYEAYVGGEAQPWVACTPMPASAQRRFAVEGARAGSVVSVEKTAGVLVLSAADKLPIRSRPELLEPLVPGMFVRVVVRQVGGTLWAERVEPAAQ